MTAMLNDRIFHGLLAALRALSGCRQVLTCANEASVPRRAHRGQETVSGMSVFVGQRLSAGPSVHYRDETDICGSVAQGGRPTTVPLQR
ncbi:hypothetical protein ACFQU9_27245 [Actinomadura namibiensis]|uniref:Uncharacterized protein n=1 Tax=Actinomadura namibiensis TaxID=182080 RepID=A0A7W3LK97_ACTNM|nr:hypothetical protein [Actinomadura namibiensis]MBA8949681.1 hypothetical protein [Actinomadura namibiensis]